MNLTLELLMEKANFKPNSVQEEAIKHLDGPLFLAAGPGSGKTRVLLWRAVNLIVFHQVKPEELFLSTFTEKAAKQLKQGLLTLLGTVTNETGQNYDLSQMYIGTVHSLCQRLLNERRLAQTGRRKRPPILLDELDQYIHLNRNSFWDSVVREVEFPTRQALFAKINEFFIGKDSESKHKAVENCISFFNRISEESISTEALAESPDEMIRLLSKIYSSYLKSLHTDKRKMVDFSLLQREALQLISEIPTSKALFKHIIIDEYQDTNSIQEKIFFQLAADCKNICVVGDDNQALYRFRGATVENFVLFPTRCVEKFNTSPKCLALNINYRSRKNIVSFYTKFIEKVDWRHSVKPNAYYRVVDKNVQPNSLDAGPSVVLAETADSNDVYKETAKFVSRLLAEKKVSDPNQIAFLFPSLKTVHCGRMKTALEEEGLLVYAPRAGKFLDMDEPTLITGLLLHIFGQPVRDPKFNYGDNKDFHDWLDRSYDHAMEIQANDPSLTQFIQDKLEEMEIVRSDYLILVKSASDHGIPLTEVYEPSIHKKRFANTLGISTEVRNSLLYKLDKVVLHRKETGRPLSVKQIINRVTTLDWNLLDLFYRFSGFSEMKQWFDLAEAGTDEGPICNLALMSQYLSRFVDQYYSLIGGSSLVDDQFQQVLFSSYLGALFRRGESEYEDANDPFPKGRIPFLTIHQAKGLEFPVVVFGNPGKGKDKPQLNETLIRPFVEGDLEPLDRVPIYDTMRLYYVALSRAQNLLIIPHYHGKGRKQHYHPLIRELITDGTVPEIGSINFSQIPMAKPEENEVYRVYSYTSDFLSYQDCPRKYMLFRKYGFAPARTTTMFFGQLVHQTLEDLHLRLIEERKAELNGR
jgi:DNA helicase II / ATP-dependent DNA helicase PcrA